MERPHERGKKIKKTCVAWNRESIRDYRRGAGGVHLDSLITNYFILSSKLWQLKTTEIFVQKLSRQFVEHCNDMIEIWICTSPHECMSLPAEDEGHQSFSLSFNPSLSLSDMCWWSGRRGLPSIHSPNAGLCCLAHSSPSGDRRQRTGDLCHT